MTTQRLELSFDLSFDGCGINGPDMHRTRIATFNRSDWDSPSVKQYGALFAAAPAMLKALEKSRDWLQAALDNEPEDFDNQALKADLREVKAAIKAAKNGKVSA